MMTHRNAAGRSSIYQQADGTWRGEVSFGVDTATRRRLRRKVRGQTKDAGAKKVRALERERDAGVVRTTTRTVASWLEEWIAGRELEVRPKTVLGYRSDFPHITRTLGRTRIELLMPEQVEAMYRDCLAVGLAAGTIHHIRRTLSAAMTTAVNRGYLMRNPVRLAACPRYELPDVEPYDEEQSRRLADATLRIRNGARWLTQLALGLRQGEVLGLQWSDLDLDGGWVSITHQLQPLRVQHGCAQSSPCGRPEPRYCPQRRGGGLHRVPAKSKASRRRLKLPDQLVAQLRRTHLQQRQERLRAGNKWISGDWVFTDEFGRPYDAKRDVRQWDELCKLAAVPRKRTHDLRHTCATPPAPGRHGRLRREPLARSHRRSDDSPLRPHRRSDPADRRRHHVGRSLDRRKVELEACLRSRLSGPCPQVASPSISPAVPVANRWTTVPSHSPVVAG